MQGTLLLLSSVVVNSRKHTFILEAWEATYRAMLSKCLEVREPRQNLKTFLERIIANMKSLPKHVYQAFNESLHSLHANATQMFMEFKVFIQRLAASDDT